MLQQTFFRASPKTPAAVTLPWDLSDVARLNDRDVNRVNSNFQVLANHLSHIVYQTRTSFLDCIALRHASFNCDLAHHARCQRAAAPCARCTRRGDAIVQQRSSSSSSRSRLRNQHRYTGKRASLFSYKTTVTAAGTRFETEIDVIVIVSGRHRACLWRRKKIIVRVVTAVNLHTATVWRTTRCRERTAATDPVDRVHCQISVRRKSRCMPKNNLSFLRFPDSLDALDPPIVRWRRRRRLAFGTTFYAREVFDTPHLHWFQLIWIILHPWAVNDHWNNERETTDVVKPIKSPTNHGKQLLITYDASLSWECAKNHLFIANFGLYLHKNSALYLFRCSHIPQFNRMKFNWIFVLFFFRNLPL